MGCEGESIWETWCGFDRIGCCGTGGVVLVTAVSRYRGGGYGVGGQRVTGNWSEANVSGGCGVGGCCEVRWEDMMGGGIGKGSVGIAE